MSTGGFVAGLPFGIFKEDLAALCGNSINFMPRLTNTIHPVFARERFSQGASAQTLHGRAKQKMFGKKIKWQEFPIEEDLYDVLRPALQLASLFLESSFENFFCKLLMAPIEDVPNWSTENPGRRFDPNFEVTPAKLGRARDIFENTITPRIHFFFSGLGEVPSLRHTMTDSMIYGLTAGMDNHTPRHVVMDIRLEFLTLLQRDLHVNNQTLHLYHSFILATTLLHELCHACLICVEFKMLTTNDTLTKQAVLISEPYVDPEDEFNELGQAWEYFMFHGQAWMVNDFTSEPTVVIMDLKAPQGRQWLLDPRSLALFFLAQLWDDPRHQFQIDVIPYNYSSKHCTETAVYKVLFNQALQYFSSQDQASRNGNAGDEEVAQCRRPRTNKCSVM